MKINPNDLIPKGQVNKFCTCTVKVEYIRTAVILYKSSDRLTYNLVAKILC